MILIFSSRTDFSTTIVIQWLKKNKAKYLRINKENDVYLSVKDEKMALNLKKHLLTINDIKSSWFRRNNLVIKRNVQKIEHKGLNAYNEEENHWFTDYFRQNINKKIVYPLNIH